MKDSSGAALEREVRHRAPALSITPGLVEQVLLRLGFREPPDPTPAGLDSLYRSWCQRVPFDNVRKRILLGKGNGGPLPGHSAEDFFHAWLRHGIGGTCWAGAGALHALLASLGFVAELGIGTMLAAPNLPPNHGTVQVQLEGDRFLVDSSILHGEPLRLDDLASTRVDHPAWGVCCEPRAGRWNVCWRPLHRTDGFECRLEGFGAGPLDFHALHEQTRRWSAFNFEVAARVNRGDTVVGVAFGKVVTLGPDGRARQQPATHAERMRVLVEELGFSEEIVSQLPEDTPTPPPPWSRTAQSR